MNTMLACFCVLLTAQSASAFNAFSMFSFDFNKPKVTCTWDSAHPVPEATPIGHESICYDNTPLYNQNAIDTALNQHPEARFFLDNSIRMYQPMNQTYFKENLSYGGKIFRYQDMCPVNPTRVLRVNTVDPYTKRPQVCNIVNPYDQNILMAECGFSCVYEQTSLPNHFCVPDGYIDRWALVFCPSSAAQCRPVQIKIPVGCSCKKYTCLKY